MRDPRANYRQSLEVLRHVKRIQPNMVTKSSSMLGLGEADDEVLQAMKGSKHFISVSQSIYNNSNIYSGAPTPYMEIQGNPSMNFLMVIMASGITRGRVRTTTTTTTESRKMAAILQVIG